MTALTQLNKLQQQYGNDKHITFEQLDNGIFLAKIDNALATATISLYGGHVVTWQPKSQDTPVLWCSELVQYKPGKAIRAGVPVCWPWFGAHPTNPKAPSHGYARINNWLIDSVSTAVNGATEICMSLCDSEHSQSQAGVMASLSLHISIGEVFSIAMTTRNTGKETVDITEALHAYFYVSDIAQIQISGLSACKYVDLIDNNIIKTQSDTISFSSELSRVFVNTTDECLIHDPGLSRTIKIAKTGSKTTVVWNPGIDTATKMDDLGSSGWRKMVCVETANALTDIVHIEPEQQHTLTVAYSVENC